MNFSVFFKYGNKYDIYIRRKKRNSGEINGF